MASVIHAGLVLAFALLAFQLSSSRVGSEPTQDRQALLDFLSKTPHSNRLQWNASSSACSWVGVVCDAGRSSVVSLRLPAVGLLGNIPADTLGRLSQLRVLSLRSNRLTGPIPADFSRLVNLRNLFLQDNRFSGGFPAGLANSTRLIRLDLSSNNFSGEIPAGVNNLSGLNRLYLQNNGFTGKIPSLNLPGLSDFNVSKNRLNGQIPSTLSKFPASSFAGNVNLCGRPLPPCKDNSSPPAPVPAPATSHSPSHKSSKKLSTAAIAGIIAGAVAGLLLLLLIIFLCLRKKTQPKASNMTETTAIAAPVRQGAEAGTSSSKDDLTGGSVGGERNKLVFLGAGAGGGGYSFDLEHLLRASAEVLGKGSVGTSYKAVMEEGTTVVVKRLKDVAAEKGKFDEQMQVIGKLVNENVLPVRAYYYSRDEKLLVSDYMPAGSLSALLHGSRGSGLAPLVWESRVRIALSAARGIAYLHGERVVHGNVKASNVLLKQDSLDGVRISDYALNSLFSTGSTPANRASGYRAPEAVETGKVTAESDVYSFGVLLLELLTGKSPSHASLSEEGVDLPRWVQSVVREEWTAEVFDVELIKQQNVEQEMVELLQIAMACVPVAPAQRPKMSEVVQSIEKIHKRESDHGTHPSSDDPSRGSGGVTP
ncbi:unnamed protein product [Cuscuta campestris]|uniref:Protein kinase domain-containing protein n=1 Tax=Cuscuta campestris TaxID=132261 RepID=A0A484LRY9_9ASTE|nr:unnamed protein product [Cuscuta campestris]